MTVAKEGADEDAENPAAWGLGTQLRRLLERLDGDVASLQVELGLVDHRPRYTPVIRALVAHGALSIGGIARATGVTHSAASQTVAQMTRAGLLQPGPARDARQRVVEPTARARELLPILEEEWRVTEAAVADLDAELPIPLSELLSLAEAAVQRRPLRDRIASQRR